MKTTEIQAQLQASREQVTKAWLENQFLRNPIEHLKTKVKEGAVNTTKKHPILVGSAVALTGWLLFRRLFSRPKPAPLGLNYTTQVPKPGMMGLIIGGFGSILSFTRPIWGPKLTSWLTDRVSSSTNSESHLPRPNHP